MKSMIKELWHGNIIPQEDSRNNSKEMKELLGYMARHHESVPGYRDADEKVNELREWVDKKYVREGGAFREARKRNVARNRNMKASGASSMEDMMDSFEKKASMMPYIVMGAVVLIVVVMLIVMIISAYV